MTGTLTRDPVARRAQEPPIDPRMRARRIEVQRDRGRRRLRRVVVLGVLVAVLAAAYGVTRTPLLDVDHLRVSGTERTSRAAVLAAAGVRRGDPLLDLDPGAARRRIEALPWIDDARVVRAWPGTVRIRVTERRPVAVVAAAGGDALVDRDGRVLAPASGATLPEVRGVRGGSPGATLPGRAAGALAVAAALPRPLVGDVRSIEAGGRRLVLRSGTVVQLCDGTDREAKLLAVTAVLSQAQGTDVASVDACVPGAPALTPRGGGA